MSSVQFIAGNKWYFVGGNDMYTNNTYYWLDGTRVEGHGYTNWYPGYPKHIDHDFMGIRDYDNYWVDTGSQMYYPYFSICENGLLHN